MEKNGEKQTTSRKGKRIEKDTQVHSERREESKVKRKREVGKGQVRQRGEREVEWAP